MYPKVHILIVQGYGSMLGLSSPSSYLVQELLLNFWPTTTSALTTAESMKRVILAARPTEADEKFVLDICIPSDKWWEQSNGNAPFPSFEDLDKRFTASVEKVPYQPFGYQLIQLTSYCSTLREAQFHQPR